jgi:DivIVA domain-containing protein
VIVLEVLLLAAVLFGVAAVAAGRGDALADAPRDGADLGLPADRPLLPADLETVRFPMAVRGYRMAEVDETLDRLAVELAERDERIAELESAAEPTAPGGPAVGSPAPVDDPGDRDPHARRPGGSYRVR